MGFPGKKGQDVGVQSATVWAMRKLVLGYLLLGLCSTSCEAVNQILCPVVGVLWG